MKLKQCLLICHKLVNLVRTGGQSNFLHLFFEVLVGEAVSLLHLLLVEFQIRWQGKVPVVLGVDVARVGSAFELPADLDKLARVRNDLLYASKVGGSLCGTSDYFRCRNVASILKL